MKRSSSTSSHFTWKRESMRIWPLTTEVFAAATTTRHIPSNGILGEPRLSLVEFSGRLPLFSNKSLYAMRFELALVCRPEVWL